MDAYIERTLQPVLLEASRQFPAVVLTGPRQSGKTTILKRSLGDRCGYVSLESPDIRSAANADPRGFLQIYSPPIILDEVQYAPELLPYIKEMIDTNRSSKGQFFITGSQNLLMMSQVTESLAGRAAILRLLPLSFHELAGCPQTKMPWDAGYTRTNRTTPLPDIWRQFLRGGYPELAAEPERNSTLWYSSYIQTYLERDVRGLKQIGDLTQFQSFLRTLAARSGQLLNLSDISKDLGIAVNTVKAWISVLESTYQIITLRPYFENMGKRLVKTPKIYFTDTGVLCYLAGLRDPDHAAAGPLGGAIVETAVVSEVVKSALNAGVDPQIYFWRTSHGTEVDIVIDRQGRLVPIEVKQSATPRPLMSAGILAFLEDYSSKADRGWVVHLGNSTLPLAPNVTAIPFTEL